MKVDFICTCVCVSCADAVNLLIPPHQELARAIKQGRARVKNSRRCRLTLIANRTPQPCTFATSAWLIKLMREQSRLAEANACGKLWHSLESEREKAQR